VLFYKVTGSANVRILMRAKYLTGFVLLFLLMTGVVSEMRAQDEVPGPDLNSIYTPDPNEYDEKPLLYEPEGSRNSRNTIDSSSAKSPALTPTKKPPMPAELKKSKEESDPLNFNFLFYIIQKFKSSDLMME
jgi:hypothetical protein